MLTLTNIQKTFAIGTVNEKKALQGVDLHLDAGDFVTVLGSLTLPAAPKRPAKPQAQPRAPQQPQQSRPARQQPPKAQNAKRKSEAGLIRALAIVAGILAVILLVSLVVLFTKNKNQTDSLSVPASASYVLLRQENAPTGLWETQL